MTGEDRDTEWATGRRRACLIGVRARSARARSPELIAVKIRAPSSPFPAPRPAPWNREARSASGRHVNVHAPGGPGRPRPRRRRLRQRWPPARLALGLRRAPSSPAGAPPTSTPGPVGAIEHATGATDVILRYEEGGGFVMPAIHGVRGRRSSRSTATARSSSGTSAGSPPGGRVGHAVPPVPHRQDERGADPGAARVRARRGRSRPGPSELPERHGRRRLDRGLHGQCRRARQDGLRLRARYREPAEVPDLLARSAFRKLRERLVEHRSGRDRSRPTSTRPTATARSSSRASPAPRTSKAWPWKDIKPAEFVADGDPNAFQLPARVLTVADAELLGIAPYQGGFIGLPHGRARTASSTCCRCARFCPTTAK